MQNGSANDNKNADFVEARGMSLQPSKRTDLEGEGKISHARDTTAVLKSCANCQRSHVTSHDQLPDAVCVYMLSMIHPLTLYKEAQDA